MNIGIFGGSFDPVHLGHLYLAYDAAKNAGLDKVYFVPVYIQPFKQERHAANGTDRVNMLRIGFNELPEPNLFQVSEYELNSEKVSYTYETLRYFKSCYPEDKLYFIMGEDSILRLENWKESKELLTNYSFIIGKRPGCNNEEMLEIVEHLRSTYGTEIIVVENRLFDVSSTYIRDNVHLLDLPDELIPEGVEEYIEQNGLYR